MRTDLWFPVTFAHVTGSLSVDPCLQDPGGLDPLVRGHRNLLLNIPRLGLAKRLCLVDNSLHTSILALSDSNINAVGRRPNRNAFFDWGVEIDGAPNGNQTETFGSRVFEIGCLKEFGTTIEYMKARNLERAYPTR